ncbi:MAG: ABC transporter substrate-binding protein [Saprospiraceae bacterium]|nr:ABC transporter substrate-binding protein [Saprospiraceae bacterium]
MKNIARLPWITLPLLLSVVIMACDPSKKISGPAPTKPTKPIPGRPEPIDTVRWTPNTGKPPIKNDPNKPGPRPATGDTYHIGFLLPFLTNQAAGTTVPEKSRLGLQFYAGAKIALEKISAEEGINLIADVWDTQSTDADFQNLLNNTPRLQKPALFIGPVRSTHVEIFAEWAKARRKIVLSPESPNSDLTKDNPDFIQLNPSLQAHCEVITRYVRQKNKADAVTLVCRQKEADRLAFFQQANTSVGGTTSLTELIMPDETLNFDKADLRKYLKPGRNNVFVLPSWSSQDFVMAFLRKLKEVKGSNQVEVYGMPQWKTFESIDAEYFTSLGVHISASSWIDYQDPRVKAFQDKFYESTGTIPDEDAFNGYDVTLFAASMLVKYGLSFPDKLGRENFSGLHGDFKFAKVNSEGADSPGGATDYWENKYVHILKFGKSGFVPVAH